ncbi:preprotein translocase subunit SecE [Corynebacterium urogenitale]|uniref:Protein translocase subunit SecE n=1 Tax=Corynebacterium urogenitale TaxID=2487892 RepID=A0A5J6ZA49_9CORY|nr:preprotein translocase subunit SecE [Corynebacterium urogenitale]QFQ03151.1 preprotein translocase subunit SecE [Corynebacterium urogenitale]
MSDESTKTPAAGGAGEGSAPRPAGKRQVAGTATTARATSATKAPEVVKTRKNPFAALVDFFRGVFREMSKVIWPTGKEMVTYTIVVLVFLVVMTALVAGVDWGASKLVDLMFQV